MSNNTNTAKATTTPATWDTTYVVRNAEGGILDSRTSKTMNYTHALVGTDKGGAGVYSYHGTEAAARKAAQSHQGHKAYPGITFTVVPVEAHKGGKAAVLRRLLAQGKGEGTPAPKAAPKAASKAKATPAKGKATKATSKATKAPAPVKRTTPPTSPVKGVQHPGALFLALMEKAGTSQTKTANTMGVAPMTLNRLCNGHGIPTAKVTVAFAKAVGADAREVWASVAEYELALALADAKAAKK